MQDVTLGPPAPAQGVAAEMDLLLRWLDEGTTAETRDSTGLEAETDDVVIHDGCDDCG